MKRFVLHIEGSDRYKNIVDNIDPLYEKDYEIFGGTVLNKGYEGISYSFKNIILRNYNEDCIHILEDDVLFTSKNSRRVFENTIKELPGDWNVFLGTSYSFSGEDKGAFYKLSKFCSFINVVIRKSAYDYILNHDTEKVNNIDVYTSAGINKGHIRAYLCNPLICIQKEGYSFKDKKNVNYNNIYLRGKNILWN